MKKPSINLFLLVFLSSASFAYAEDSPLVVGVSLPLSGPVAEYGEALRNGIELAREEHTDLLSNIRFLYEDDRYDGRSAVSAFNKFRTTDGADLVFTWGIAPTEAIAPLAERYKIPFLANSINPAAARGKEFVVRFNNHSSQYTAKLLQYLRSKNLSKIASLKTTSSYCDDMMSSLEAQMNDNEKLHSVASLGFDDADFRTHIGRMRQDNYDAVFMCLFPGQLSTFFRQAGNLNFRIPFFGTDTLESATEIANAGPAIDGAIFAFNSVTDDFRESYVAKYGDDIQISTAANGYDLALMLGTNFSSSQKGLTPQEIMDIIRNSPKIDGASGRIIYREDEVGANFFDFPVVLKQIQGDTIRVIE